MTPETRIMQTIKKLHISNPTKEQKIYDTVVNNYYERYIKIVFWLLDPDDQATLTDLIDRQSTWSEIESFIESTLPDIAQIAESSLNHFLFEYEERIWIT